MNEFELQVLNQFTLDSFMEISGGSIPDDISYFMGALYNTTSGFWSLQRFSIPQLQPDSIALTSTYSAYFPLLVQNDVAIFILQDFHGSLVTTLDVVQWTLGPSVTLPGTSYYPTGPRIARYNNCLLVVSGDPSSPKASNSVLTPVTLPQVATDAAKPGIAQKFNIGYIVAVAMEPGYFYLLTNDVENIFYIYRYPSPCSSNP